MYCKHCGREIDDNSSFCKYCGGNVIDTNSENIGNQFQGEKVKSLYNDPNETEVYKSESTCDESCNIDVKHDDTQREKIDNSENTTIENTILRQTTEEVSQENNISKNQQSKKGKSCSTIIIIAVALLIGQFFITPMAKLYMRQRMKHQVESSGVYGAGLDKAEPIMNKIKKEAPYCLGMFGKLNKASYGIGTIILEFEKSDYDDIPNGNAAKGFVLAQIKTMSNSMKKILKDIVEEDFSLSIEIRPSEDKYSSYIKVDLSPDELGQALSR